MNLLAQVRSALERHKGLSVAELGEKVRRNAFAFGAGRVHFRGCTSIGPRARAFGAKPHIENHGEIRIGSDFAASSEYGTLRIAAGPNARVRIGDGVTVNYGTAISARASVTIGDFVKIGPYCIVADTEVPWPLPDDEAPRPIEIGERVWLGARVIVMPGASIGAGAVIAAGSVVFGVIPGGAIASGSPARVLRVTSHAAAS